MTSVRYVLLLACAVLAACPQSPTVPPPDATDGAPAPASVQAACRNLADLNCPEGLDLDCVSVFDHVRVAKVTRVDFPCLASARSAAAARACGFVECKIGSRNQ